MKKKIAIILIIILTFSLASCGKKDDSSALTADNVSGSKDSGSDGEKPTAKPTEKPKVTIVDAPPRATEAPDESLPYFEREKIEVNYKKGDLVKFEGGACYVEAFGTGYEILDPFVQVEEDEYSPDDGNGNGHYTFVTTYYCKEAIPKDFRENYCSVGFGIYDRITGKEIVPVQDGSPKLTYVERPDGDYALSAELKSATTKSEDCPMILVYRLTVNFTKGYSGLNLILIPAQSDRDVFDEWCNEKDYYPLPAESRYIDMKKALVTEMF